MTNSPAPECRACKGTGHPSPSDDHLDSCSTCHGSGVAPCDRSGIGTHAHADSVGLDGNGDQPLCAACKRSDEMEEAQDIDFAHREVA